MFKILKFYFAKLRCMSLLRRLNKATAEAYDINKMISKSDLPQNVKDQAANALDVFVSYTIALSMKKQ